MRVVKFHPSHLQTLELQEAQHYFRSEFGNPEYGELLASSPYSFTGLIGDKVIGCAGVHEVWPQRGVAWALIGKDAGQHFFAIHRAVSGFLSQAPWRRIEMMVEAGFVEGNRWAKMLGMEQEGLMRAYSPTGVDYFLYARIKNG